MLESLVKLKAPTAAAILLERLKADDPVVRAAAAAGSRRAEAAGWRGRARRGVSRSASAIRRYIARAAALGALAQVRRRPRRRRC